MNTLTERQAKLYPDTNKGWQVHVASFREYLFGNSEPALWSLFAAVGMVLLIACANVANLQLAARTSDAASWLCGSRSAPGDVCLVRHSVIENLLLCALGCGAGLLVAIWCLSFVRALGPDPIPP